MSWISIDVEADGPTPGLYSMVSFGAVVVRPGLQDTFYSDWIAPVTNEWRPESLKVGGAPGTDPAEFRAQLETHGKDPATVMTAFATWVDEVSKDKPRFISDNNGFDWQWINHYLWKFCNRNPFGWSSTNLGSLYKGQVRDVFQNFKHLRKTAHDHNALNDAIGNAEALLAMQRTGLKIKLD